MREGVGNGAGHASPGPFDMALFSYRTAIALLHGIATIFERLQSISPNDEPTEIAIDHERYRAAVAALPADTRTIFLLHCVDDLDIAMIAARTGHPPALVEQHIADAILAIWRALDGTRI